MELLKKLKNNNLAKDLSWSIFGGALSKALLFISWILVARIIGKEVYGEFTLIRSTYLMMALFIEASLGLTLTRYISKNNSNIKENNKIINSILKFVFVVFLILTCFLIIDSDKFLILLFNDIAFKKYLYLIIGIVFFTVYNSIFIGIIGGYKKFKQLSINNIIHGFSGFVFLIFGAYFYGLVGILFSIFVSQIIVTILNFLVISKLFDFDYKLKFRGIDSVIKVYLNFTLPAFLAALCVSPVRWLCEVHISKMPDGFNQLGLLGAANQLQAIVLLFTTSIYAPLLSYLGSADKDSVKTKTINYHLNWIVVFYITLPFLIFPDLFMALFGTSYISDDFKLILRISIVSLIVQSFNLGISRKLAVENKMWWALITNLIYAVSLIIMFFKFFKGEKGVDLMFSILIAFCLHVFLPMIVFYKKKWISDFKDIKMTSLTLILLIFCQFLNEYPFYNLLLISICSLIAIRSFKVIKFLK